MASANTVILIGNITRDHELRSTPKGMAVLELGLAVNRKFTVDGEAREETTFVEVTVWGRLAENVEKYTSKGSSIYVEGRLQMDQWEDKETREKRSKLRVVANQVQFLSSPQRGAMSPDEAAARGV